MSNSFIPKVNLPTMISSSKIDTDGPEPYRLSAVHNVSGPQNFSEVMSSVIKNLDDTAKKPDKIMTEALINPNIDVHDVMIAVNQSEITLTIATQMTTKIIQGYEKIISMQV